ncbi:hypothetical protein CEE36_01560 [candidate division TA06 bacterium B3_TA06]|uniref:Photosynthesis system II assembly factor Ycf48/Hcf136-like domain-containing protein n=1 Tax=candidate division TA06 bacterium B3_TA06 TaxID=2012487 RepID=A0A532V9I6_UNCT6|nr:MAG: hypothetical protein CEE36_01560 [candidate division TA06 bacterium B3_TA06]
MVKRLFSYLALLAVSLTPSISYASWEILDLPTDRGFGAIWAIDEQTIFVSGHQGLWKAFDGATWSIDSGYQSNMIYFVDDTLGFLSGKTLTTDGGRTWQKGDTVNGHGIQQIFFPPGQSSLGYGVPYLGNIRKTEDGGWHWEVLPTFPDIFPTSDEEVHTSHICFPSDPDTGYLTAEIWQIISLDPFEAETYHSYFKTTDGGQSWVLSGEGLWNDEFKPYLVDFPQNPSTGYMAGYGKVFKTTDGGETWDTIFITSESYPNIYDICFPETDQVGYVLNDTMVHKTTDGGKAWRTFGLGKDTVFLRCHFLNNLVGFISGTGTTAYNLLYTPGFVLKTTDGLLGIAEEDWVEVEPSDIKVISSIGHSIVLCYSNCPQGFHASIYDPCGRKVDELHSSLTEGTLTWGEGAPSGVYFIQASSGNPAVRVVIVR